MKLLLNLIWLVFGGLLMALGYAIVALVILIIAIPFGVASARITLFWPFGRTLVRRPDDGLTADEREERASRARSRLTVQPRDEHVEHERPCDRVGAGAVADAHAHAVA